MTKFEEELYNKVKVTNIELTTEAEYKKSTLINHFKNWHSDEEFQALLDKYSNLNNNYEKEVIRSSKLESQIIDLKSQLQQQALPVVPECVAEFITKVKKADNNLTFAFNSKFDECPAKYWNEAIVWRLNNPDEFARAWLDGYTIEKPQLFKLIFPNSTAVLQKDGELNSFAARVYKRYLIGNAMTEQEIKSIDERYWQFAVPVEDGE